VNRCLFALLLLLLIIVPAVGHDDSYEPDTLTLTFLDVGQGDAILVQAANGQAMLVDAGEASAAPALGSRLAAKGVTHLAYLVGTHDHDDHIGGMASLVGSLAVDEYLENGDPAASETAAALHRALALRGIPARNLTAGETIPLDPANITVTVLNPQPVRSGDENEDSIVLRLVWG
jgi:competence protein ComEC